jgi:prepilin-type N-terminal cleavage/methylation domain-containing protein
MRRPTSAKNHSQAGFTIIELLVATAVLSIILLLVTTMMISIGNLYYKGVNQSRVQDSVRNITDEVSQQLELSGSKPAVVSGTYVTPTSVPINVYCIGSTRYSYVQDVEMGTERNGSIPVYHDILWRDVPAAGCNPNIGADLTDPNLSQSEASAHNTAAAELLPPNSRLTNFCIGTIDAVTGGCDYATSTATSYTVTIGIAYGSDDLLCDRDFSHAGVPDCSYSGVSPHMQQIITNVTVPPAQVLNPIPPSQIVCKGSSADRFCATATLSTTVANRL